MSKCIERITEAQAETFRAGLEKSKEYGFMRTSSKKTVFTMTKMLSIVGILAVVGCASVTPEEAVLQANLAAVGGADALNNVRKSVV